MSPEYSPPGRPQVGGGEPDPSTNDAAPASANAVATLCVDAEGRVLSWGADAEAMLGWSAAEAVGQPFPAVPPELWAPFRGWVRRSLMAESHSMLPLRLALKEGSSLSATLVSRRQHPTDEAHLSLLVLAESLGPAALAVLGLARSEARLRLALEATSDGVWDLDVPSRKMTWDEGCYRILGYAQGELGSDYDAFAALAHPDDLPGTAEAFSNRNQRPSGRFRTVFRTRHRAGHWVWVLSRGRVAESAEDGAPLRIVGTHTDISEQHEAEEALRESEARYRLLVEQSGEGVAMTDLEERIIYANPAASHTYGVPQEQMMGASLLDFAPPEEHEMIREQTARRVRGESTTYEYTLIRGDGQRRRILVTATPHVDASGVVVGSFGVFRDVTEEREAEERRRVVDARLAQTQRIEGLFSMAAGAAHDFSNMLMGVLGNTSLALARVSTESPIRPYLEHIHAAATEAGDLAKQLLAYSGGGVVALEPLDISEVVEDVRHLLESVVPEGVDLRIELSPDLPQVHGDAGQLSQVLVNLVTNACEAMEGRGDGAISIRTYLATLDEADWGRSYLQPEHMPARCVGLEVRDTGHGVPAHVLSRVFDPFFTTRVTGRGLGLPAALGIVRGHGGGIWVSSEPGTGTWVHVALPCIEERAPEEPGDATPSEPAARNVILIVDDQLNVRLVLSTWLEAAAGFEVLTASDGEAAISLFSERPDQIDLVVMDLSMPRMDGSEAMGHIRAIRPDIPIILSSGYGERTVRSKLQDHEPTAFVQKPYEPQVMVDLIQSVLAERRAGDSA